MTTLLRQNDEVIFSAIQKESVRQKQGLELIASENYVSPAVLDAQGSILTNKYAEGYPGKRYYGGCEHIDTVESLAIERVKKLFSSEHANVQPHSGSQANMAVYFAVAQAGETIMGMDLTHGGHLTHGSTVNFSGFVFQSHFYQLAPKTNLLDYNHIEDQAKKQKPRILIAGHSAYPRIPNFKIFREIADCIGAILLVDMAHFAGLVAGGVHPSPIPYADFVTSTTHKTLRGPRGGFILCSKENSKKLDKAIFPGIQGGPLMHIIAAKAVAFQEASQDSFKQYAKQVVSNAQTLAKALTAKGFSLVTGGTDNHLILINLSNKNVTGKKAERALEQAGITVNKNTVPGETLSPFVTSGIRIGTPAITTRGMGKKEMEQIAQWIHSALEKPDEENNLNKIAGEVKELCTQFPCPA
ncbi:MAG: serine hydroxymethyltransferase [Oligoflexia bacterium]|nr:serine hydroxymethyltransferase [Oligoflexia bacterium]